MDKWSIALGIVFVVFIWLRMQNAALKSAANDAVRKCEDEIHRLRSGIMTKQSHERWYAELHERNRKELIEALNRYHTTANTSNDDKRLLDSTVPSFQDEENWDRFQVLGRGPIFEK